MTQKKRASDEAQEARLAAMRQHPFINDKAVLSTQLVENIYGDVEGGLTFRTTGLSYEMPPRFGKTWCIKGVKRWLEIFQPNVLTFVLTARGDEKAIRTQRAFNGDLLLALGHVASARVGTADRLTAAVNLVRTARDKKKVAHGECDQIIFFIDEGQNWTIKDWGHWKDFTNQFVHHDPIHVLTVTFGQPEIATLINTLPAKPDIFYRFFLQHRVLRGIRLKKELAIILKGLDSSAMMEHPPGSGQSYSEFFLPQAYASGWRLEGELDAAWSALRPTISEGMRSELAMASVVQVLRLYLLSQTEADGPVFRGGNPEPWLRAAQTSIFRRLQTRQ